MSIGVQWRRRLHYSSESIECIMFCTFGTTWFLMGWEGHLVGQDTETHVMLAVWSADIEEGPGSSWAVLINGKNHRPPTGRDI